MKVVDATSSMGLSGVVVADVSAVDAVVDAVDMGDSLTLRATFCGRALTAVSEALCHTILKLVNGDKITRDLSNCRKTLKVVDQSWAFWLATGAPVPTRTPI